MAKVSGMDLKDLISDAVEKAKIEDDVQLISIANGQFNDCSVVETGTTVILNTVDYGPLVGDNYYNAGRIAALNALSDIYVMGGRPVNASIIFVIEKGLEKKHQSDILSGLFYECHNAGVVIGGGHTIYGEETLAGLSVIGVYDSPRRDNVVKNTDIIMVSKEIGSGIALRGYYHNLVNRTDYCEVIKSMLEPNDLSNISNYRDAIHAATDVTGFGLIGHLVEMLKDKGASIYISNIPLYNAIKELPYHVFFDEKIKDNYRYSSNILELKFSIENMRTLALFDPQTNGPVMIIVDREYEKCFVDAGYITIGSIMDKQEICIVE